MPKNLRASRTSNTPKRDDALLYLRRFPAQGRAAVALNLALVIAGNAIVLWLLGSGRLQAGHLIALLMAETILLIGITWLQQRMVPRRDWLVQAQPWREKGPLIAFVLVWLGGTYGFTLQLIHGYGDFLSLFQSLRAWREAGLHWPLLATLVVALVHAVGDALHYRDRGGPFQSSVVFDTMGRYLTLLLGGIPFVIPLIAITGGGFKSIEYVVRNARVAPQRALLAATAMLAVLGASLSLINLLKDVDAWAIGFVFAKLIAESLVACIPLMMTQDARQQAG